VVGHVDRQNTRRQLIDSHHQRILQFAGKHDKIDFRHLHMEEYSPFEQIQMASECDVLLGVHGNGLTHSLWMAPNRYVVEFFWNFNFQFDYATTAQLMNHTYLGLWNGQVLDIDRVRQRDPRNPWLHLNMKALWPYRS
jgi:capsular polysaccharide biosynthesis protein